MGKKIFLMATGQSINDITDDQWNHIKSHYSMGISWFYKKNFETTYYYTHEFDKQPSCVADKIHKSNWKTKVFFGTREYSGNRFSLINSSFTTYNTYKDVLDCSECSFTHWLNSWNGITWKVNQESPPIDFEKVWARSIEDKLFGFRGTMMCALNLCTVLGYDEIILCGVDLRNGLHFYDDNVSVLNSQFNTDSIKDKHSTCVEYRGVRPVIDGLKWISKFVNIKIISDKSLLYDEGFKVYEF
jgi:hypothetical protein